MAQVDSEMNDKKQNIDACGLKFGDNWVRLRLASRILNNTFRKTKNSTN